MQIRHALLALPIAVSAACAGSPSQASHAAPALTKAEAQQVLSQYEATGNQAGKALDAQLLRSVETGAQLSMDTAAFKLRRATSQQSKPLAYTAPVFYIPRATGYPRWFAVDAASGTTHNALLFSQDAAGDPWRLAADPYSKGNPLTDVQLDSAGYATIARPVWPIGAAHAALLTEGPSSPAAEGLAPGTATSRAYAALLQAQSGFLKLGVRLISHFTPSAEPVYALQAKDGGAVVWYTLRQRESYVTSRPGAISVAGDLVGLGPSGKVHKQLDTVVLVQYLARVPSHGASTVTGMYRKAIQATAS